MLFLKILVAILLGINLFLCIPLSVSAQYDESFEVKIKYLFFSIPLNVSAKEKRKKKKRKRKKGSDDSKKTVKTQKKKPDKAKKSNIFLDFYNNNGFFETVKLIKDTSGVVKKYLNSLFVRHLVVKELFLEMTVTGDDSADTAEKFGKISAAVYPSLGFLHSKLKIRNRNVKITPDFLGEKNKARFKVIISIKPFWLVYSSLHFALRLLVRFIKVMTSNANARRTKQKFVEKSAEK